MYLQEEEDTGGWDTLDLLEHEAERSRMKKGASTSRQEDRKRKRTDGDSAGNERRQVAVLLNSISLILSCPLSFQSSNLRINFHVLGVTSQSKIDFPIRIWYLKSNGGWR